MPQKKATPTPAKRERLTLSQLASYDDILTDALVDHVYFWTTIRKNRSKYNLTRGFSEDDITDILRNELVLGRDTAKAEACLLKLSGLRKYMDRLTTNREKEDFKKHLRKYVNIWSNDCPFEVSTTNRYTIVTQEAAVTARRDIKKGETIKYLCGNLVAMTLDEEKDLDLTRRDFSIVMSSRKKTPSLFLGPARFSNHDCNANARLVTTGSDGMQVVALRAIETNDEITVTYGEDYFGIDNCECLCRTCESLEQNGWALTIDKRQSRSATPTLADNELAGSYSLRKKRKFDSSGVSSGALTPDIGDHSVKRSRSAGSFSSVFSIVVEGVKPGVEQNPLDYAWNQGHPQPLVVPAENEVKEALVVSKNESLSQDNRANTLITIPTVRRETEELQSSLQIPMAESFSSAHFSPATKFASSQASHESSDSESVFDTIDLVQTSSHSSTPSACRFSLASSAGGSTPVIKPDLEADIITETVVVPPATALSSTPALLLSEDEELSSLASNESFDDNHRTMVPKEPPTKLPRGYRRRLAPPTDASSVADGNRDPTTPAVRIPGDYTRTPLLLSEPYSRWVDCLTCSATWVQSNGYYTRRECPRCERHSKIYGFQWPRTEPRSSPAGAKGGKGHKAASVAKGKLGGKMGKGKWIRGGGDGEERVLDHRTVHRFLDSEEEKLAVKRGKGLKADIEWADEHEDDEGKEENLDKSEFGGSQAGGRGRNGERLEVTGAEPGRRRSGRSKGV